MSERLPISRGSPSLREQPVELARKLFLVTRRKRRRPASYQATRAHFIEKIPAREVFADVGAAVELAARIDRQATRFDDLRGQRNVGRDHQITGTHALDDFTIGDIKATRYLQRFDPGRWWGMQPAIGYQRQRHFDAHSRAKQDFLDDARAGIGVDPDVQG